MWWWWWSTCGSRCCRVVGGVAVIWDVEVTAGITGGGGQGSHHHHCQCSLRWTLSWLWWWSPSWWCWTIMQPGLHCSVNGSPVKSWGCAFVGLLAGLSFICLALHSLVLALRAFAGKARSVLVSQLTGRSRYDCDLWVIVLKWTLFR